MEEKFHSKRLSEGELGNVQEVYNKTRNASFKLDFFQNKFTSNCKKRFISVMYFDGDKPIAHCAATPFDLSLSKSGSSNLVGAQVFDAVTLSEYQRKGLFNALNGEIDRIAEEESMDFLFRFPSKINYKRVIDRFEFTDTGNFKVFDFNFKVIIPIFKILQKFDLTFLSNLYLSFLSLITFSKNSVIENSLATQGFYHIPHNVEYLAYKTYSKNYKINIFGDRYWLKHGDGLTVGDFNVKNDKNFMKKLKLFCLIFGIHRVTLNVCEGTREYKMLTPYAAPSEGIPICIKSIGNKPLDLSNIKFTYADLDTF